VREKEKRRFSRDCKGEGGDQDKVGERFQKVKIETVREGVGRSRLIELKNGELKKDFR